MLGAEKGFTLDIEVCGYRRIKYSFFTAEGAEETQRGISTSSMTTQSFHETSKFRLPRPIIGYQ